jgi:hypothetical protein
MDRIRAGIRFFAIALATGGALLAQVPPADNIPNWPVPATWSPARASGGYGTMTDISQALPFVAIAPCRIADTRGNGFGGQAGGPIIPSNTPRAFQIAGAPAIVPAPPNGCAPNSIPVGANAVSFQFTIVSPTADGNLIAWNGGVVPQVSVLNWPAGTVALGNGTIVPLGFAGVLGVQLNMAFGQSAHLVIDVNGYFSAALPPGGHVDAISHPLGFTGNFFDVHGDSNFTVAHFVNSSESTFGSAVEAQAESTANGTAGVLGRAVGGSGNIFGGTFSTNSTSGFNSAGVKGISGYGDPLGPSLDTLPSLTAGVRGVDNSTTSGFGVIGISRNRGVGGLLLDPTDMSSPIDTDAEGYLGYRSGMTFYGVLSFGGTGGTGIKSFVEPHATDPSKVIRYVSLEGPEAGTYFRGKGRFARGIATIEVPEDFRMVTDREGLSIQVTPIGEMATVAVVSIGLDRIVVKASRNVEFFYLVHGVRATFKDHVPIKEGLEFMPRRAEATMPGYLSEGQKQLLIRNGTYKADGTVNMETAHRLGWDRAWEARMPSPSPESAPGVTNP